MMEVDKQMQQIKEAQTDPYTNLKTPGIKVCDGEELPYADALERGVCVHCQKPLAWQITKQREDTDDRCCMARCCGVVFSMVPTTVRIIEVRDIPTLADLKEEGTNRSRSHQIDEYIAHEDAMRKRLHQEMAACEREMQERFCKEQAAKDKIDEFFGAK